MKKRLIKTGIITTLLGVSIIIFSGAMLWTGKASAESLSGWLALGIMFLRSNDSLIGLGPKE
jgi:type IV secretory pathway VirB2 component (pilin)